MSSGRPNDDRGLRLSIQERMITVCDRFESQWKAGRRPQINDYLSDCAESEQPSMFRELLALDVYYRKKAGHAPSQEEYLERFAHFVNLVGEVFDQDGAVSEKPSTVRPTAETSAHVISGQATTEHPAYIGRYRIDQVLGQGGFEQVYLAHDDALKRPVAIKVPHADRVSTPEDVEFYLTEAQVVAGLDHPSIVPVYDVGRTDNGLLLRSFQIHRGP